MSVNKPIFTVIQEIKCDLRILQIDNKKLTNELTCIRKLVEELILNQNKILHANDVKIEPIKSGWFFS
jgi:hypothetical protein|tara:strand:- start:4251 stop:4454 length:204 start_codon:yes stop_codon:yes gene_type:complete